MISNSKHFGDVFYDVQAQKDAIGVSSMKIFDGEDLTEGNRRRLNQIQQRKWLDQQVREKEMERKRQEDEDNMFRTQRLEINNQWTDLNNEYEKRRKDVRVATKDTQLNQLSEKCEKDALDRLVSDNASKSHINYCLNNDFYTENTQTCQSHLGKHRVLPYHWKGFDDKQRKQVLQDQERMRKDRNKREDLEKQEDLLWAMQQEDIRRKQVKMDRLHKRCQKTALNEVVEFNKLKALEDKSRANEMYDQTHDYKVF